MFVTHIILPPRAFGCLSQAPHVCTESAQIMVQRHDGKPQGTGCFLAEWNSLGTRSELQQVDSLFNTRLPSLHNGRATCPSGKTVMHPSLHHILVSSYCCQHPPLQKQRLVLNTHRNQLAQSLTFLPVSTVPTAVSRVFSLAKKHPGFQGRQT